MVSTNKNEEVREKLTPNLRAWQKRFKLRDNLLQEDIEAFEQTLYAFPARLLGNTGAGASLRSAIKAGWIETPETKAGELDGKPVYFYEGKEVSKMHGGAVRWLGNQVDNFYSSVTTVPKAL